MHGLIFETSVCYWQNQPGCYLCSTPAHAREEYRSQNHKVSHRHPQPGTFPDSNRRITNTDRINDASLESKTNQRIFLTNPLLPCLSSIPRLPGETCASADGLKSSIQIASSNTAAHTPHLSSRQRHTRQQVADSHDLRTSR